MYKRTTIHASILLLLTLTALAPTTNAQLVTIAVKGVVDSAHDDNGHLGGDIHVGDIVQGTYTYDTSAEDLDIAPFLGEFYLTQPPCGISLNISGHIFQTDPTNVQFVVDIYNDAPRIISAYDAIVLRTTSGVVLPEGIPIDEMSIGLESRHEYGNPLSSDALPLTVPILDDWAESGFAISGEYEQPFSVSGHLTEALLVPEPSTATLLTISALALIRTRPNKTRAIRPHI